MVIAIEARVEAAEPAPDGRKAAVRMEVFGLTPVVRARLERLVTEAARPPAEAARGHPLTRPPVASEPERLFETDAERPLELFRVRPLGCWPRGSTIEVVVRAGLAGLEGPEA